VKTAILKLEPYDDIVSVREKMDWSRSARILIVYPEVFDFLDRRIDLLLLKRTAQDLGAQIAVVSTDLEIQQNAREAGIPFFQTAAVAQKLPWRRSHFRHAFREGQGNNTQLSEMQSRARPAQAGFWQKKLVRIAAFSTAILVVIVLILFFMPSATIYLPDLKEKQTLIIPIWANQSIISPLPSGGLPAFEVTVVVESQGEANSSGQAVVPDKAAFGQVLLTNLTSQAVKAPAATIVLTTGVNPVKFELLQDVTVPGGAGQIAFARIQAVSTGTQGNVLIGEIKAIEGDLGLLLTVTNPGSVQGGGDRKAASPSDSDYATLHQQLLDSMRQSALQELKLKLTSNESILPVSVSLVKVLNETQEPAVGQPSEKLRTTIRAEYRAWYIHLNDQTAIERTILDSNLAKGMAEISGTFQTEDVTLPQIVNGTANWEIRASRDVHQIWNRQELANMVLGKAKGEAKQVISNFIGVAAPVRIVTAPSWWPFMPPLLFQIQVGIDEPSSISN